TRLTLCLEPGAQQRNAHYGHTVKWKFQPTSHATNPTRPVPTAKCLELAIMERLCYLSNMERFNPSVAAHRFDLISRYQSRMGQRLHSTFVAYACLGLLWATPIAAMAAGLQWSVYTGLIVVVITAFWAATLTRKRGVTMPPTYPSSRATIYAVLLFTVGTTCA